MGGKHTVSHTLEEERRAETDKEQEWGGGRKKNVNKRKGTQAGTKTESF